MQTKKMSLAIIKGKLTRGEMKKITAGSGCKTGSCSVYNSTNGTTYYGSCVTWVIPGGASSCICGTSLGYYVPTNSNPVCKA